MNALLLVCSVAATRIIYGESNDDSRLPHFSLESDFKDGMLEAMASDPSMDIRAVLVLSYGNGGEKCAKIVEKFMMERTISELTQHSEEEIGVKGIVGAMLADKAYERKHGLRNCPNLILYRDNRPIAYDGDNLHIAFNRDEVGEWIARNMKSSVNHLSDETFEHLTQASTGSTTGDWVIWFHKTSCSDLTAIWEALASRLKYSKVVGEVDTTLNPKLAERFHLKDCQSILMFRQGRYYTYTGDAYGVHALANFAEISYKNFNSQLVRPPPSPFDEKVEQVTRWLKESDYGLCILVAVTFVLFGGLLYLVGKEAKDAVKTEKKEN